MKDIITPVPQGVVRNIIKHCLEEAALVNYTRISEYAKIEGIIESIHDVSNDISIEIILIKHGASLLLKN